MKESEECRSSGTVQLRAMATPPFLGLLILLSPAKTEMNQLSHLISSCLSQRLQPHLIHTVCHVWKAGVTALLESDTFQPALGLGDLQDVCMET